MIRRAALLSLLMLGLAVCAALALGWRALHEPLSISEEGAWLIVSPGASMSRVMRDLHDQGVLPSPQLLTFYARLRGDARRIHAGEYRLVVGATPLTLLEKLVTGAVYLHQLTVVEGWRFSDLLTAVRTHPAIRDTELDAPALMAELGAPGVDPEGQFFPDTYRFARGTTDLELLRQAHESMVAKLADVWARREPGIILTDPYQALVLASIIEKETSLSAERKLISAVFHRRLERGMRLQTDPTVIYGLGDQFDGNLRRADLTRDTPYNTYTRAGLPPTPISLPGLASLEAAVMPDVSDALYFVATGEPDGSHYFSTTLEQHNEAVAKFLARQRAGRE